MSSAISERIRAVVAPIVADIGLDLYDVEYHGGALKVVVDTPAVPGESPATLDLDVLTQVTRAVSRRLDEDDPIAGTYTLEVSSPGLERPLRTADHFRRAVGSTVAIKTRAATDGPRRLEGTLVAVDDLADGSVSLAVETSEPRARTQVSLDDVERARTVFAWGPAPKPGGPSKPGKAKKRAADRAAPRRSGASTARDQKRTEGP